MTKKLYLTLFSFGFFIPSIALAGTHTLYFNNWEATTSTLWQESGAGACVRTNTSGSIWPAAHDGTWKQGCTNIGASPITQFFTTGSADTIRFWYGRAGVTGTDFSWKLEYYNTANSWVLLKNYASANPSSGSPTAELISISSTNMGGLRATCTASCAIADGLMFDTFSVTGTDPVIPPPSVNSTISAVALMAWGYFYQALRFVLIFVAIITLVQWAYFKILRLFL